MEKSDVLREVLANPRFRERVRAIASLKAKNIIDQETPDASELAWAKLVGARNYDAWLESLYILLQASPATTAAAYDANDATYATVLTTVLPSVLTAKEL